MTWSTGAQHPSAPLYTPRFCPICARLRRILRLDALRSIWRRGGPLWRWNEPVARSFDAHSTIAYSARMTSSAHRKARGRVARNASVAQCGYALDVRMRQSSYVHALSYGNAPWDSAHGSLCAAYCAPHDRCASTNNACAVAHTAISAHSASVWLSACTCRSSSAHRQSAEQRIRQV